MFNELITSVQNFKSKKEQELYKSVDSNMSDERKATLDQMNKFTQLRTYLINEFKTLYNELKTHYTRDKQILTVVILCIVLILALK